MSKQPHVPSFDDISRAAKATKTLLKEVEECLKNRKLPALFGLLQEFYISKKLLDDAFEGTPIGKYMENGSKILKIMTAIHNRYLSYVGFDQNTNPDALKRTSLSSALKDSPKGNGFLNKLLDSEDEVLWALYCYSEGCDEKFARQVREIDIEDKYEQAKNYFNTTILMQSK